MGKSPNEMGNCLFASPWLRHCFTLNDDFIFERLVVVHMSFDLRTSCLSNKPGAFA
jgi:hypothetical protein